ncbi:MAG: YggS family pyridoxal phosphate-dependent enzyme [Gammaproteobacteria bacterium]
MTYFTSRLNDILCRIDDACEKSGRDPGQIRLIAVSKRHDIGRVREAIDAGQIDFGENLIQEAIPKIAATRKNNVIWHFIGHLQSNKTRAAATHFDWVHTVDSPKIARRLSDQRPATKGPLMVCIQVRIGDENSKSGVAPDDVPELANLILGLPNLELRGLMTIPPPADDLETQRGYFEALREIKNSARLAEYNLDTLSMGMSGDLEAAIFEGATMLRIGTALFGPRPGSTETRTG